jgi:low temperature requirement protein LtrA
MTDSEDPSAVPWRRPIGPRDPRQPHRAATSLELLFDLCFVVAVAYAGAGLHHAIAENHEATGMASYLTVFFAIWWAWMNFTWHASAYDNDDGTYRLAVIVQITGALIIAAGIPRAFEARRFEVAFYGYLVMRAGLAFLWLRAARSDPACRKTCRRYALGITIAMCGWFVVLILNDWPLWAWWLMALVELAVPAWAESATATHWHPHHIAERYGLFTIIVLGESVLAATHAVRLGVEGSGFTPALVGLVFGGLLILFSLWWIYFAKPAHRFLTSSRAAFTWGYGHYFIFGATAAVGAGLAVNVDHVLGKAAISGALAGASVAVPVAVFLLMMWLLVVRPQGLPPERGLPYPFVILLVLAATFAPWPVLTVGAVVAAFLAGQLWLANRRYLRQDATTSAKS